MSAGRIHIDYTHNASTYEGKRFQGRHNEYLETLRRRAILRAIGSCSDRGVLLDVGCGTGRGLNFLQSHGWRTMVGLDYTRAMLEVARANVGASNSSSEVFLLQGDAFKLPFADQSVSAVVSLNFLHMFRFDLQQALVREMFRVCKHRGVVVAEFESLHKGLFFSRYLDQRRVAHRNKFNSLWEIRDLFPKERVSSVRIYGTTLPMAYRVFSFVPAVGTIVESINHWPGVKWLCDRVVVSAHMGPQQG